MVGGKNSKKFFLINQHLDVFLLTVPNSCSFGFLEGKYFPSVLILQEKVMLSLISAELHMINLLSKGSHDSPDKEAHFILKLMFFFPWISYWPIVYWGAGYSHNHFIWHKHCSAGCCVAQKRGQSGKSTSMAWLCWENFQKPILEGGFLVKPHSCPHAPEICSMSICFVCWVWPASPLCRFMGASWVCLLLTLWRTRELW